MGDVIDLTEEEVDEILAPDLTEDEIEEILAPMPIIPVLTKEGTVYLLTQDISVVEPHTSNPDKCWIHTSGLEWPVEAYQSQASIVCLWMLWFGEG